ncbi:MAG: hypothetical protein IJM94_03425 [Clostridia bacterium]|nr:hypothetical protein [Clostridia bacterium]
MTSKELNLKLIQSFPEIKEIYHEETSWQDGDETGSHVVYEDVFVPFIKKQISDGKEQVIDNVFNYIEILLESNDEYASEVIALSVIESLAFDEDVDISFVTQYAKPHTLKLIKEILDDING